MTTNLIDIEKALQKLRHENQADENVPALFNLLIYTEEERRTKHFGELASKITEKFPCRIFFIQKDNDQNKNYISCNVGLSSNSKADSFVCDQIFLKASGKEVCRIPFILLPHLITDLPTHLLWGEDPCNENQLLSALRKISTSLIFDSESTDNLQRFCQTMLDILKGKSEVTDLNWTRLGGWREIIAKTFDSKDKVDSLSSAKLVQISYASNPSNCLVYHPEAQAIYMQAWIASTLGWKFTSWEITDDYTRIYYQNSSNNPVLVEVCPHIDNALPEGSILALEISGENKHFFAIFTRKESSGHVSAALSNDETCDLPLNFLLPNYQERASFLKDIFYGVNTDHYPKMLNYLAHQEISQ